MEPNLKAAIIGYYLSGATMEQIVAITGCFYLQVVRVIEKYKKTVASN